MAANDQGDEGGNASPTSQRHGTQVGYAGGSQECEICRSPVIRDHAFCSGCGHKHGTAVALPTPASQPLGVAPDEEVSMSAEGVVVYDAPIVTTNMPPLGVPPVPEYQPSDPHALRWQDRNRTMYLTAVSVAKDPDFESRALRFLILVVLPALLVGCVIYFCFFKK